MHAQILDSVRSRIVRIKFFKDLLTCALCTGFWSGLIIGTFAPYNMFLFALYSSAFCYLTYIVNEYLIINGYPSH